MQPMGAVSRILNPQPDCTGDFLRDWFSGRRSRSPQALGAAAVARPYYPQAVALAREFDMPLVAACEALLQKIAMVQDE